MKRFFTIFVTLWVTVGAFAGSYYLCEGKVADPYMKWSAVIVATLLAAFISAWWMPVITDAIRKKVNSFSKIPLIGTYISILDYIVLGYVCALLGYKKRSEIGGLFSRREKSSAVKSALEIGINTANPKVLDTSVIIDGRINDICQTGFIEGQMVIPNFVLDELRHISDSSDLLRRNRGRRGLDILHRLQKDFPGKVVVTDIDYPEIAEVDSKLLQMAKDLSGVVITNDYNLNKVAQVQGVQVLNINELSNALKPVVLPGEKMTVEVIREGKEQNQGLAYLDDGTMIVIENGKKYIGQTIDVEVSSVLQTSAGRMIFVRYSKK